MMGMVQGQLAAANLEPDQMANIMDMGIQSVGLKTAPGGIHGNAGAVNATPDNQQVALVRHS